MSGYTPALIESWLHELDYFPVNFVFQTRAFLGECKGNETGTICCLSTIQLLKRTCLLCEDHESNIHLRTLLSVLRDYFKVYPTLRVFELMQIVADVCLDPPPRLEEYFTKHAMSVYQDDVANTLAENFTRLAVLFRE